MRKNAQNRTVLRDMWWRKSLAAQCVCKYLQPKLESLAASRSLQLKS